MVRAIPWHHPVCKEVHAISPPPVRTSSPRTPTPSSDTFCGARKSKCSNPSPRRWRSQERPVAGTGARSRGACPRTDIANRRVRRRSTACGPALALVAARVDRQGQMIQHRQLGCEMLRIASKSGLPLMLGFSVTEHAQSGALVLGRSRRALRRTSHQGDDVLCGRRAWPQPG